MDQSLTVGLSALGLATALLLVGRHRVPEYTISPDGRRYLAVASGAPAPFPFALRWLLPRVCGASIGRWRTCTAVHMIALPALTALWLTHRVSSPVVCVAGGLLVCGLPGVWKIHIRWPVLVDPAAMTWAVASAVCAQQQWWLPSVACALVAGSIKETAPIFAACYAWHPLALIGLVSPIVRAATAHRGPDIEGEDDILAHPLAASRRYHRGRWLDPTLMLTPWGLCLVAPAASPAHLLLILAVTSAVAYGQVLLAVNTVRLYQWAAPVAILCTAVVLPPRLAVPGLLLHLLNPWAGDGL